MQGLAQRVPTREQQTQYHGEHPGTREQGEPWPSQCVASFPAAECD